MSSAVAHFMLRLDAGRFMLEKYWSLLQTNFMEAKESFGDDCGKNYANSQFSNQNRQDAIYAISRVLAV